MVNESTPGQRLLHVRIDRLAVVMALSLAVAVLVESVVGTVPFVRPVATVFVVVFGLGSLTLAVLGVGPKMRVSWLLYSLGLGLFMFMVLGVVLHGILGLVGYERSLATVPLLAGVVLTVAGLREIAHLRGVPLTLRLRVPTSLDTLPAQPLALLLLPLWSILAISALNGFGRGLPLLFVLGLIAVLTIVIAVGFVRDRYVPLAVWAISISVLYHKSLWASHVYGGHASVVTFYEEQTITLTGTETLVPNIVLMPGMAHLSGIEILTQLKVVFPFVVSFLPLALFVTFRRYTDVRTAFLGAALFVFAHPFYYQYPSSPRASMPVLFFALIGLAISDDDVTTFERRSLSVTFAAGLAVSHYGTAFYVMFALAGVFTFVIGFDVLDDVIARIREDGQLFGDNRRGVFAILPSGPWRENLRRIGSWQRVLTPRFIFGYSVMVLGWYLYTAGGKKFVTLTEHVVNAYVSLFVADSTRGATATRLVADYGAESIQLSKYLYAVIGFLTVAGLTIVYFRRFFTQGGVAFDDGYMALATWILILFGGTFILSGEWGGGRPMMIVLSYNAVFAVLAVVAVGDYVRRGLDRITDRLDPTSVPGTIDPRLVRRRHRAAFAAVLAVFFLLNSGVIASVTLGGYAPSNVPLAGDVTQDEYPPEEIGEFVSTDIQMHVWMADHMDRRVLPYRDRIVYYQATDWYNGEIAAHAAASRSYRYRPSYNLIRLESQRPHSGYVLLGGHNVVSGTASVSHVEDRPISDYELGLGRRNKVYDNSRAVVYYHNETGSP